MAAAVRAFLAPILANLKLAALAAAIALVAYLLWQVRQSGADAVTTKIEKDNNDAITDANLAALSVDDCHAARAAGQRVRFDFGTAKCVRSGPSGGPE